MKKTVFIAWQVHNRRSELLAQHLGASMYFVNFGQRGKLWQLPVRYPVQAWQTWRILLGARPDMIFVQNPPIFCVLIASIYARCYGAEYVIDSHTSTFISPGWRWSLGIHRLLSRGALTTIVTNHSLEQIVNGWGCRAFVLGFTPGYYPVGEAFPFTGQFNVAVVSSFEWDEPLEVLFEAARQLPLVRFYITGDSARCPANLLERKPDNCWLTGYLPYEQYIGLLRGAGVVMDLVSSDQTLLLGAFEAVSLGTPVIMSDWPVLRNYFPIGTVHVSNTVEGIRDGVRSAQCEQATLRRGVLRLRDQLEAEWTQKIAGLQNLMAQG